MKQYCRYCVNLCVNDFPYCKIKEKALSEAYCKRTNNCKDYQFADCEEEYQDALMKNVKGYKPRQQKQCEGQMSLTF